MNPLAPFPLNHRNGGAVVQDKVETAYARSDQRLLPRVQQERQNERTGCPICGFLYGTR